MQQFTRSYPSDPPNQRFIVVKIAIISDIHSNLPAMEAALDSIEEKEVDRIYCLGDIVGYGADPGPCLELVRTYCDGVLRGNHDEAVALERGVGYLPSDGQVAARHNRNALTTEQIAYLANLPLVLVADGFTFVHATPQRPESWQRLDSYQISQQQFDHFDTEICFVGHTHIPAVMAERLGVLQVRPGNRYLVNVGSVGQPRDHNPWLSYGLFDTEAFTYENVRCPYDIGAAATSILAAGLPRRLADRLKTGH